MTTLAVVAMLLELALLVTAGFVLLRAARYTLAEAAVLAIIGTLMTLSFVFQVAFLLRVPELAYPIEAALAIAALVIIIRRRSLLAETWHRVVQFVRQRPFIPLVLGMVWLYQGALAIIIPSYTYDGWSYHLPRIFFFQQERTVLLTSATLEHQAVFPVGSDILAHMFLRFQTDYGVPVFAFLSYVVIAFGIYALSRHYALPDVSLLTTLIVISMPTLLYASTVVKNDIIAAAVAVACVLLLYRLLQQPNARDLILLGLTMLFGVSVKTLFIGFVLPFTLLFGFLLIRKHGIEVWFQLVRRHWRLSVAAFLPALIFSQVWLFAHNAVVWDGVFGPPQYTAYHKHDDGLIGATANVLRFLYRGIEVHPDLNHAVNFATGYQITNFLQQGYDTYFVPILGDSGMSDSPHAIPWHEFTVKWGRFQNSSAFGPIGLFIIIPAMLYVMLRGSWSIRLLMVVAWAYLFIVAWQVAWMISTVRFLMIFYVLGGVALAYVMQKLIAHSGIRTVLTVLLVLFLSYVVAFQGDKHLVASQRSLIQLDLPSAVDSSIWIQTDWGRDRYHYIDQAYQDGQIQDFQQMVPSESRIGLLAIVYTEESAYQPQIYPYLYAQPDVHYEVLPQDVMAVDGTIDPRYLTDLDYVLLFAQKEHVFFERNAIDTENVQIWQSAHSNAYEALITLQE